MAEERFTKRVENLDFKVLKAQVTLLNNLKVNNEDALKTKIKLVAVKKDAMTEAFSKAVEEIGATLGDSVLPESVITLYNDLYAEEDTALDSATEEKSAPKEKAEKKEKAAPKEKAEKKEKAAPKEKAEGKKESAEEKNKRLKEAQSKKWGSKNEYGVRPGTLPGKFVDAVLAKPMTMKEATQADWNPQHYTFNDTLRRLQAEKLATVSDDGVITIKKI